MMKNETIDFVFRVKNTDNLFNTAAGDAQTLALLFPGFISGPEKVATFVFC